MNRRATIKLLLAAPVILQSAPVYAQDRWFMLGRRVLKPNVRTISFTITSELVDFAKLGIELKGNSIWIYNLRVIGSSGKSIAHPLNLNIPPVSNGCSPRLSILAGEERPRRVELDLECLPLTGKPTEILLWGTA